MPKRRFYLAVQTTLPQDYQNDRAFSANMETAAKLKLDGVELNIADPFRTDAEDLKKYLAGFGLELSMFASGGSAKALGLSLAHDDEDERKRSVTQTVQFLEFAARFGAGVIAGFLKGPLIHNSSDHRKQLMRSIADLAPHAERLKTPLLIEAINRFESPIGHSLDDTYALVEPVRNDYTWILPDTWHMNIEEVNMEAAIFRHAGHFGSFHLSENNRFFPGFGMLDFKHIVGVLDGCGYQGKLAIEGNVQRGFSEDLTHSMRFLEPLLE